MSYEESAKFIYNHLPKAVLFEKREDFWRHTLDKIPQQGAVLEFGAFKGDSINFFSNVLQQKNAVRTRIGFDSLEGWAEDWSGTALQKSTFDQ